MLSYHPQHLAQVEKCLLGKKHIVTLPVIDITENL